MVPLISRFRSHFLSFYQRHSTLVSILMFCLGFLIDILTISRIYSLRGLIQQGVYLLILGILLVLEIRHQSGLLQLSDRTKKWWDYHNLFIHFLFGSLLSLYTIFYYTSASAIASFIFIILLAGLMFANEMAKIRAVGLPIRIILFTICTLSFFSFFYPIIFGRVGVYPFWLGFLSSLGLMAFIWFLHFSKIQNLKNKVLIPALGVHLLFLLSYYTSLIPPVPLALKRIGIYHSVEKRDGKYIGKYRPDSSQWWSRDKYFLAQTGDKINILLSIFSPLSFRDEVTLRWFRKDPRRGWILEDSIPLIILGGREEGFRGFGVKQFYAEGEWRILVETSDGREVGRIQLRVKKDASTSTRVFKEDIF